MKTAILLFAAAAGAYAQDLRAGAAQVVITPPPGAPMYGYYYNRAAEGVHDDLHAKALVFEKDGVRAALVVCDVGSLFRELTDDARRQIEKLTGIPGRNVMISATHTHTGPVLLAGTSRYNLEGEMKRIAEEYTAALPGRIAESVRLAAAALKPARIRSGTGREDSLTFNRRFHMKDGTVGWNPGKLNPNIVRPAGPIDGSVPVLYVETADGKPIASYVNYALHLDTVGGMRYSSDYPHTLGTILKSAKGDSLISLFTIGCAGNLNHIDVTTKEPQKGHEESARIGAVLAGEVLRTMKRSAPATVDAIRTSSEVVKLPIPSFSPGEVDKARTVAATFGQKNAAPFLDLVHAAKVVEIAERRGAPIEAEVQVIALGDEIAVVSLPGEIFTEIGLAIKQGSPFRQTVIAELANGGIGYVPDRKGFSQGAYEAISSRTTADAGDMLVTSAIRQLIALKNR
jgi:hypothetical protein